MTTTVGSSPDDTTPTDGQVITVGGVTGVGDAMMINVEADRQLDLRTAGNLTPWAPLWRPQLPITIFRPAFATDQANQNVLTTLDIFSGNDHGKTVFPFITQSKIRRPERVQNEIVDRASRRLEYRPVEVRVQAGRLQAADDGLPADAPDHARPCLDGRLSSQCEAAIDRFGLHREWPRSQGPEPFRCFR